MYVHFHCGFMRQTENYPVEKTRDKALVPRSKNDLLFSYRHLVKFNLYLIKQDWIKAKP